MSEIKLLPCPFCGGEAKVIRRKKSCNDDGFLFEVSVKCEVCGSESRRCLEDENKAIMIWNTRKPMERIVKIVEDNFEEANQFGCGGIITDMVEAIKEEGGIE